MARSIDGFLARQKRGIAEHVTVNPTSPNRFGLDSISHFATKNIASDLTEAGSIATVLVATGHQANVGDVISFTSGINQNYQVVVAKITTNTIELAQELQGTPSIGDAFDILRYQTPLLSASGSFSVSPTLTSYQPIARAKINGVSITGAYQTLISAADHLDAVIIQIFNSVNGNLYLSLDGGVSITYELDRVDAAITLDLGANGRKGIAQDIQVKHSGVVPTGGVLKITVFK